MAMRKGDADFRNVVNGGLMEGIESGKYFEIYDKWFGPKGELPYPMCVAVRSFMLLPGRSQVTRKPRPHPALSSEGRGIATHPLPVPGERRGVTGMRSDELPVRLVGAVDRRSPASGCCSGLITTLELSVLAWMLAVALGVVSGALRTVRFWPLRAAATFYVEFFRNVPLLVWMFFWYFGDPAAAAGGRPGVALRARARVLGGGLRAGRV